LEGSGRGKLEPGRLFLRPWSAVKVYLKHTIRLREKFSQRALFKAVKSLRLGGGQKNESERNGNFL
jgi:hypothetical protein